MLTIKPNTIKFETQQDIIDYVTRGMCPTKKNFDAVMAQVRNPSTLPRDPETKDPYISPDVIPAADREVVAAVMERVYENRKWNRNVILGTAGVVGGVALLVMLRGHMKEKEKDDVVNLDEGVGECHFLTNENIDLD